MASTPQVSPAQLNEMQRQAVLSQSVEMTQPIFSQGVDTTKQTVVKVQPRNVGLIKRFIVIVEGVIQNTDGAVDAVTTPFGIANILSNISVLDFNGNTRINTGGWHIASLNTAKGRWPYASALQASVFGTPLASDAGKYGANYPVLVNPLTVLHGASNAFRMVYDVPLAYSDDDLRGAIFGNVVNATMGLELTINNAAFVVTGADDTLAVLRSGTCSFLGNLQITVYQVYLDQLPIGQGGTILPIIDLSTIYELKTSAFSKVITGMDFAIPYANFRDFLSTFVIYNNSGGNDGHGIGQDVGFWALQSANFTNLWKLDPLTMAQRSRDILGFDFPAGTYYVSHRRKPISTTQYGNMEIILNATIAGPGAYLIVGWEDFALVNVLTQAGSLARG